MSDMRCTVERAGWLFLKGVNAANQLSERMDKIDGGGRR